MLGCPWLTVAGLLVDAVGVLVIAAGALVGKRRALQLGLARLAASTDEENLRLPAVRHILAQSRNTVAGLLFIVVGLLLQVVGSWPT